ncbi:MAG: hypothetical protein V1797_00285 [Pseudomonadota bacterium]
MALAAFYWQWAALMPAWPGAVLALIAAALNGAPIIWEAARGLWQRRVSVDELVSLAIRDGAYGLLSPIAASIFHNAGSIIVVLTSASLVLMREKPAAAAAQA